MKTINIKAHQSIKIISKFSNSIPTTYEFSATCLSNNEQPSGTVEVKGSNWIFSKPPLIQPLKVKNTVSKTMWDTFYSVYITPDHDTSITLENGQMNRPMLFIAMAIGIAAIAASLMIFVLN